jgi:hypothetical protein
MRLRAGVQFSCKTHPRYNPAKDGHAGIKGGCATCVKIFSFWKATVETGELSVWFARGLMRGPNVPPMAGIVESNWKAPNFAEAKKGE